MIATGETQAYVSTNRQQLAIRDFGSGGRDRTYDQLINSQLLYR